MQRFRCLTLLAASCHACSPAVCEVNLAKGQWGGLTTGQPRPGPEHLECVRELLRMRAGLQLSQLLLVQSTCAELQERKVQP